ncbi:Semaphorin-3C, partial [Clarias magur]
MEKEDQGRDEAKDVISEENLEKDCRSTGIAHEEMETEETTGVTIETRDDTEQKTTATQSRILTWMAAHLEDVHNLLLQTALNPIIQHMQKHQSRPHMCHCISEKLKKQKLDNRLSSEPLDEDEEPLNSGKCSWSDWR